MLAKFEIILDCEENFANWNMGSLFHGVLMELLPSDYAGKLHENQLKPFSQHIEPCDKGIKWSLHCLNDGCMKYIGDALMSDIDKIELKNKEKELNIISRSMKSITYKNLIDDTYFGETSNFINIYFNTPSSFKVDGRYIIYPDMELIYKNLVHKFDAFSNEFSIYDEYMIESLIENSMITSYKLQSVNYSMESIKIPSYIGRITVRINNSAQIANIAKLLFSFGEYSGIGIKTALGMGAVRIEEVKRIGKR